MIKNQWYAITSSKSIKKNKILALRRFGENLVLYRDSEGTIGCVTDLCAHRGASLQKGCVKDGHIQCPFHGIEYDASGKCVYVPSEGKASELDFSRFNLKSYETREIGGIVFAWYGDDKPDSEPDVFDVMTDYLYAWDEMTDHWKVQYSRVIENQLDVSHLAFVHRTTIGRGNKTLCNGPKVVWLDHNTLQTSADNESDVGQKPKGADESTIKSTNLTFKFPNMWLNHVTDKIMILAYFIPVDDENSIIALRFYNKITGIYALNKMIAWLGSRANKVIERQDKRIVETQLPKASSLYTKESLVAADLPIMEYRKRRGELQGTSTDSINKEAGKRKENKIMSDNPMHRLTYGLFVLTARHSDKANGCIINTGIQVANTPDRIAIAVNKANYTHDMIKQTGQFVISVLSEKASFDTFKRFGFQSGKDVDKFDGFKDCRYLPNGIPYITAGTNAYFSIKVTETTDFGSHTLFVGTIEKMEVLSNDASATYDYYQNNIKPKPEDAAKKSENSLPPGMHKWRCKICGFEYIGETLPEDYICEICKHPASDFELVE